MELLDRLEYFFEETDRHLANVESILCELRELKYTLLALKESKENEYLKELKELRKQLDERN